eukprot:TRINITY_DN4642_c0_g1_i1.p1 TRINITY_DN4642_c0_g1~~TRINITY_DN4642_c0_g1_i1.p1  ORF type:complete len:232 (+),score=51.49 TRINITY_DN4642_c0_g1_i1:62-697(+)
MTTDTVTVEKKESVWKPNYDDVNFNILKSGGHSRCWKFMTHPEGWLDNIGVLCMIAVPVWLFTWIMTQDMFPAIFMLGTCNIVLILTSLLLLVPDSRDLSTYRSVDSLKRLLNYDKRMTPNSFRHMYILGSWIFQLLVLCAVILTECRIILLTLVDVEDAASASATDHTLFYRLAEQLSSSLIGNLITVFLTTFSATFFGFSWFVGCFVDR